VRDGGVNAGAAGGPPWPGEAAWIDGRYCPIEAAKISVLDLGVTRSDCTYDVVHVWEGKFFRLEAHLDRFAASLARLRLDPALGGRGAHHVHGRRDYAGDRHRRQGRRHRATRTADPPAPPPLLASHADPRYATPVRYDEPG
jgi:hypothetical protein